jgi:hypothetical protein
VNAQSQTSGGDREAFLRSPLSQADSPALLAATKTVYMIGMIRRRRSTEDRRQILLNLTDQGQDAALSLLASIDHRRLLDAVGGLKSSLDRFMSIDVPGTASDDAQAQRQVVVAGGA